MGAPKRKKIVFVCTGNTCRSPMAEVLLKNRIQALDLKGYTVLSAGIRAKKGEGLNPKSAQVLTENGLEIEGFESTPLTEKLVREAFAIVCMTEAHKERLTDMRWNALKKAGVEATENNVYSFYELVGYEIRDPYGEDVDGYRYAYDLLAAGVNGVVEKLRLRENAYQPKTKSKTGQSRR